MNRMNVNAGGCTRLIAAAAMLALAAGGALAQNALGDGTGLQRDLGRGVPRGRVNNAASFQRELNLRNAIVTGNAAGGASFRGDVGYVAPGEFRGELGSNDLFAFRRDSLFSGFAGMGIRGTDALQYQFALTTGSPRGLLGAGVVAREGGSLIERRPLSNEQALTLDQQIQIDRDPALQPTVSPEIRAADQTDQGGSMMGMLRSLSAYNVNRGIQPEIMSAFQDANTGLSWGLTASSLRGVRMSRLLEAGDLLDRPGAADSAAGPNTAVQPGQPDEAAGVQGATRGPDTAMPGSYQAMMERYRAIAQGRGEAPFNPSTPAPGTTTVAPGTTPSTTPPGATTPGGLTAPATRPAIPDWEARLQEIRDRLAIDLNPGADEPQAPGLPPTLPDATLPDGLPVAGEPTGRDPMDAPTLSEGTSAGSLAFRPLDPEVLRIIRESGVRIDRYAQAAPGTMEDVYTRHMEVAGSLMSRGAYFDAEERFTRAQAAKQNDYLATVGRMHAQLGAGMFLSAGVNLRRLLSDHPEVAAVRFDASMLPAPARLHEVVTELRNNASKALDGQSVLLGTDSALLLAYIGYQREDSAVLSEGLNTYRQLLGDDAGGQGEQASTRTHGRALLDMITAVWGNQPQTAP